jgi:ABC-2 type transport system permease protein
VAQTLFSSGLHTALFLQPFAGLVDIPYRIYLGDLAGADAIAGIGLQFGWTAVLAVAGRAYLNRILAQLLVQGG